MALHPLHVQALRHEAGRAVTVVAGVPLLWTPLIGMRCLLDGRGNSYEL